MTLRSYKANYLKYFGGNSYIDISSIDESGGILCPQTSGQAPFYAHFDAGLIAAIGTSRPFEDLFFRWDCGDASSAETFTDPGIIGGTKNSNSDQLGPKAVHCYRTPGTYTTTLTIYGYSPLGLRVKTITQQIVVTTYDKSGGEFWADSTAGGTNAGTLANPFNTVAAINSAISSSSGNVQFHSKRDSNFTGSVALNITKTPFRMDAYGTGAKPIFDVTSGSGAALFMQNGSAGTPLPKDDVVVSDCEFRISGTNTGTPIQLLGVGNATATVRRIYLDNCNAFKGADNGDGGVCVIQGNDMSQIGTWNCNFENDLVVTHLCNGLFAHFTDWFFMFGGRFRGGSDAASATSGREHHIYPDIRNYSLYRWIDFQEGPNRNYCFNMNYDHVGAVLPEIASNHLIADCNLSGVFRACDFGENLNDPSETRFRNVVVERCKTNDLSGDGVFLFSCADQITLRDINSWGCHGGRWWTPGTAIAPYIKARLYRINIHHDSTLNASDIISLTSSSYTQPNLFREIKVQDERVLARIMAIPFGQQMDSDYNQFWAPNDANGKFLRDNATDKTLAEFQAAGLDVHSVVADPSWTDPANGDFT